MRTLYIAYGSNLHQGQMARRCPDAEVVGSTTLRDYCLLFRGNSGGAVATIEPKKGATVPVLLWEISDRDQVHLDRYEGWPSFYRKELMIVEIDGAPRPAMVYIMNEGRPLGLPGDTYYNTIVEGYKGAGFELAGLYHALAMSNEPATDAGWGGRWRRHG